MRTERFDSAVAAALDEAAHQRLFLIARFQDLRSRSAVVDDGDRVTAGRSVGVGLQVFTVEGWCGFAASDDTSPAKIRDLVRRAGRLAQASGLIGPETNHAVFGLPPGERLVLPRRAATLDSTPPKEHLAALRDVHHDLAGVADGFSVRTRASIVEDAWRIARTDGTDVSFVLTRATVSHLMAARSMQGTGELTASASISGNSGSLLFEAGPTDALRRRAIRAIRRAREGLSSSSVPVGSYRIAIDYGLAKGLAHEAVGHACETDVAPISYFAKEGRLRLGEQVGPPHVSIVDEPIAGDVADQPISANGLVRRPVEIVRHGVLSSGLGDLFSAERAGSPMTGACRTGSYRQRPTPRMTNTRIVVADPLPLGAIADPEAPEPEEAADALRGAGLLNGSGSTLYLAGYRGGQAHPSEGDFLFACAATYDLTDGCAPRRPATFSGHARAALLSIMAGLGDLHLDAAGTCGKNGLNVSSSGGSHALLVLDAHPDLLVGGSS